MKLLSYLGYMIMAVLVVVCGNILYSVLSVKMAERLGILPQDPESQEETSS